MKKYIKANKVFFTLAVFWISLSSAIQIAMEFLKGYLVDLSIASRSRLFYLIALAYMATVVAKALSHYIYSKNFKRAKVNTLYLYRKDFFEKVLARTYTEFKDHKRATYIHKYSNEMGIIDYSLFDNAYALLQTFTSIIFGLIGLILIDWRIALLGLIIMALSTMLPFITEKWLGKANTAYLQALGSNTDLAKNYFEGFEPIYNYRSQDQVYENFVRSNQDLKDKKLNFTLRLTKAEYISNGLGQVLIIALIGLSLRLMLAGTISVGSFVAALSIMLELQSQTRYIGPEVQAILATKSPIESIKEIVGYKSKNEPGTIEPGPIESVDFIGVDFSYQGKKQALIKDLNFGPCHKGLYLIRGQSGSGKSTLMNLLLGYYPLDRGTIRVNGLDIRDIKDLNQKIGILRQEAMFFEDSLRANLTMYEDIDDQSLIAYMKKLGLDKYANKESLDTIVYNNGHRFSGGEQRRLSFIRTMVKDCEIIILDEPFANIDQRSINNLARIINQIDDKIVFLISHQEPDQVDLNLDGILEV